MTGSTDGTRDEVLSLIDKSGKGRPTNGGLPDELGGLLRRISLGTKDRPSGSGSALADRIDTVRSRVLGTRGSATPQVVIDGLRRAYQEPDGSIGRHPGATGVVLSAAGGTGVIPPTQEAMGGIVTDAARRLIARIQPLEPVAPAAQDREEIVARKELLRGLLDAIVAETQRVPPRREFMVSRLERLKRDLKVLADLLRASAGQFRSDAVRNQEAAIEYADQQAQVVAGAWVRFFLRQVADPVVRIDRQLPVLAGTIDNLWDRLDEAGLSREEAGSPESDLHQLDQALDGMTLADLLDQLTDLASDANRARLAVGDRLAAQDIIDDAKRLRQHVAAVQTTVGAEPKKDDSQLLDALRDPLVRQELGNVHDGLNVIADVKLSDAERGT